MMATKFPWGYWLKRSAPPIKLRGVLQSDHPGGYFQRLRRPRGCLGRYNSSGSCPRRGIQCKAMGPRPEAEPAGLRFSFLTLNWPTQRSRTAIYW
jgi:hypothetical protein